MSEIIDEQAAIRLVEARTKELKEPGWTYEVIGCREHPHCWAVGVQPYNPAGQPSYDPLGYEVDKITGAVGQWR